jgi:glycosyltransferase involved in cell wall biosynthesis
MGAHMLDLAEQYVQAGAEVSVMCWPTPPGRRALAHAERVGAHPFATTHPRDPRFGDTITDFLAARPTDVFHAHVGTGRENFDGARAARRAGVPVVVQTQHLPWKLTDTRKRVPFFHGIEQVDRLIAVSAAQRATYERIGVPPERFSTVPNGVRPRGAGPGREEARRLLGLAPDQPVVMTVGRLIVMKGQRFLVDSVPRLLERFGDLAVLLVGEGHLRAELSKHAAELGVSSAVRLLGHRADARMLLDAADVFVLPSLHEGMPLAAMEAMDASLPVVGTDVIGTAEVVADGETGLLVPPRDPGALATALGALLSDPDLRARYGAAARRRYLQHFTSARMAADTAAVYDSLLRAAGVVRGPR